MHLPLYPKKQTYPVSIIFLPFQRREQGEKWSVQGAHRYSHIVSERNQWREESKLRGILSMRSEVESGGGLHASLIGRLREGGRTRGP